MEELRPLVGTQPRSELSGVRSTTFGGWWWGEEWEGVGVGVMEVTWQGEQPAAAAAAAEQVQLFCVHA